MHTTNLAKSLEEVDATLREPAHRDNATDVAGESFCGLKSAAAGGNHGRAPVGVQDYQHSV